MDPNSFPFDAMALPQQRCRCFPFHFNRFVDVFIVSLFLIGGQVRRTLLFCFS